MTIINTGSFPFTLTNGTTADATQVMSDFNFIISQVNANGAALAGGNAFTGTQTIGGDAILTASAAQTVSGKTFTGPNGTAPAPTYSFSASTGTGMWSPATNALGLASNGTNALYIDASQNIGFKVTPSAWGTISAIEGTGGALGFSGTSNAYLTQNLFFNGANWIYKTTAPGTIYVPNSGFHQWQHAVNGSAGSVATMVTDMSIDNSGNLLVGAGTLTANFNAAGRGLIELNGSSTALVAWKIGGVSAGYLYQDGTNFTLNNLFSGALNFNTNNVQRLGIDNIGRSVFAGSAATTPSEIGNVSGAVTLDCSKSNVIAVTLNGNITGLTLSNISSGQTVNIFMTQDGTGSRTLSGLTSGNNYLWAGGIVGSLSTAPGSQDLLCITLRNSKFYTTLTKAFA